MYASHAHDDDLTAFKLIFSVVGVVVVGIWVLVYKAIESQREGERLKMVSSKYSGETASLISKKMFWPGQTAEQLKDSLGEPQAVEVKPMKTRYREIWKYGNDGANRYRTRITLDDGVVTTWTTR